MEDQIEVDDHPINQFPFACSSDEARALIKSALSRLREAVAAGDASTIDESVVDELTDVVSLGFSSFFEESELAELVHLTVRCVLSEEILIPAWLKQNLSDCLAKIMRDSKWMHHPHHLSITIVDWRPILAFILKEKRCKKKHLHYHSSFEYLTILEQTRRFYSWDDVEEMMQHFRPFLTQPVGGGHMMNTKYDAVDLLLRFLPSPTLSRFPPGTRFPVAHKHLDEIFLYWSMNSIDCEWDRLWMNVLSRFSNGCGLLDISGKEEIFFSRVMRIFRFPHATSRRDTYPTPPTRIVKELTNLVSILIVTFMHPENKMLPLLEEMLHSSRHYCHPQAQYNSISVFSSFICSLTRSLAKRRLEEAIGGVTPANCIFPEAVYHRLSSTLLEMMEELSLSRSTDIAATAIDCFYFLGSITPPSHCAAHFDRMLRFLRSAEFSEQTPAVLGLLSSNVDWYFSSKTFSPARPGRLYALLKLCLLAINPADTENTNLAFTLLQNLFQRIPMLDTQSSSRSSAMEEEDYAVAAEEEEEYPSGGWTWHDFAIECLDTVLNYLKHPSHQTVEARYFFFPMSRTMALLFAQIGTETKRVLVRKVKEFVFSTQYEQIRKSTGALLIEMARSDPDLVLDQFLPVMQQSLASGHFQERELKWSLYMLSRVLFVDGKKLLPRMPQIRKIIDATNDKKNVTGKVSKVRGKVIKSVVRALAMSYPLDVRSCPPEVWNSKEFQEGGHIKHWNAQYKARDTHLDWHIPSEDEIRAAVSLYNHVSSDCLASIAAYIHEIQSSAPASIPQSLPLPQRQKPSMSVAIPSVIHDLEQLHVQSPALPLSTPLSASASHPNYHSQSQVHAHILPPNSAGRASISIPSDPSPRAAAASSAVSSASLSDPSSSSLGISPALAPLPSPADSNDLLLPPVIITPSKSSLPSAEEEEEEEEDESITPSSSDVIPPAPASTAVSPFAEGGSSPVAASSILVINKKDESVMDFAAVEVDMKEGQLRQQCMDALGVLKSLIRAASILLAPLPDERPNPFKQGSLYSPTSEAVLSGLATDLQKRFGSSLLAPSSLKNQMPELLSALLSAAQTLATLRPDATSSLQSVLKVSADLFLGARYIFHSFEVVSAKNDRMKRPYVLKWRQIGRPEPRFYTAQSMMKKLSVRWTYEDLCPPANALHDRWINFIVSLLQSPYETILARSSTMLGEFGGPRKFQCRDAVFGGVIRILQDADAKDQQIRTAADLLYRYSSVFTLTQSSSIVVELCRRSSFRDALVEEGIKTCFQSFVPYWKHPPFATGPFFEVPPSTSSSKDMFTSLITSYAQKACDESKPRPEVVSTYHDLYMQIAAMLQDPALAAWSYHWRLLDTLSSVRVFYISFPAELIWAILETLPKERDLDSIYGPMLILERLQAYGIPQRPRQRLEGLPLTSALSAFSPLLAQSPSSSGSGLPLGWTDLLPSVTESDDAWDNAMFVDRNSVGYSTTNVNIKTYRPSSLPLDAFFPFVSAAAKSSKKQQQDSADEIGMEQEESDAAFSQRNAKRKLQQDDDDDEDNEGAEEEEEAEDDMGMDGQQQQQQMSTSDAPSKRTRLESESGENEEQVGQPLPSIPIHDNGDDEHDSEDGGEGEEYEYEYEYQDDEEDAELPPNKSSALESAQKARKLASSLPSLEPSFRPHFLRTSVGLHYQLSPAADTWRGISLIVNASAEYKQAFIDLFVEADPATSPRQLYFFKSITKGFGPVFYFDFLKPQLDSLLERCKTHEFERKQCGAVIITILTGVSLAAKTWPRSEWLHFCDTYLSYICAMVDVDKTFTVRFAAALVPLSKSRDTRRLHPLLKPLVDKYSDEICAGLEPKFGQIICTAVVCMDLRSKRYLEQLSHVIVKHVVQPRPEMRMMNASSILGLISSQARPVLLGLPLSVSPSSITYNTSQEVHQFLESTRAIAHHFQSVSSSSSSSPSVLAHREEVIEDQASSSSSSSQPSSSSSESAALKDARERIRSASAMFQIFWHQAMSFGIGIDFLAPGMERETMATIVQLASSREEQASKLARESLFFVCAAFLRKDTAIRLFDELLSVAMTGNATAAADVASSSFSSPPSSQSSSSTTAPTELWRLRVCSLKALGSFTFRHRGILQTEYITQRGMSLVQRLNEFIFTLLKDSRPEIREAAAGLLLVLLQFHLLPYDASTVEILSKWALDGPQQGESVAQREARQHGGALALCSYVRSAPFAVPEWAPPLLLKLAKCSEINVAIVRTAVSSGLRDWWQSHSQGFAEQHKHAFSEDDLSQLYNLLISPSYYA